MNHAEAFNLMLYRSDDGTETEQVWNSRDGVTPFVITLRSGKTATHVDWQQDRHAPHHVPRPGDRVFVDLTPERAREKVTAQVESWMEDPGLRAHFHLAWPDGRGEAIAYLVTQALAVPGQPDLVEVGPEGWKPGG